MEKIIKRLLLLIPVFLASFTFKINAYAEELEIYRSFSSWNSNDFLVSCSNCTNNDIFTINMFTDNLKINLSYDSNYYYNRVVFYNSTLNGYIYIDFTSNNTDFNSTRNIMLKDYGTWYGFQYLKNNDTYDAIQGSASYFTNTDDSTLFDTYSRSYYTKTSFKISDNLYLKYYKASGMNYEKLYQDIDNQELSLIYIKQDKFLLNGVEIPVSSPSQPEEPESEEPEIPIFNANLNKFYVPNYHEGQCVEVIDKDTIRVFENEIDTNYIDYYINSNYISKTGQIDLNYEKNCSDLEFTDIRYYGNDFPQILFILFCITIFTIGIPYILYKRFRKR